MARSALLNLLQRVARRTLAEIADPDHLAGLSATRGTASSRSRRIFLQRATALALMGTASWSPPSLARADRTKVIIIGAGLAGLTAARTLRRAGVIVQIHEGSPRVGGRCWTERHAFPGQLAERGGELIDTSHAAIRALAAEFDLPLDDLLDAEPKGSEPLAYFDSSPYTMTDIDRDFRAMAAQLAIDVAALGDALPTYRQHTAAQRTLDHMSAAQWIQSRVPGGRAARFGRLLANAYTEELGGDPHEISAITVVALLAGSPADRFSPYEESDQRFHIRGGNDQLAIRMASELDGQITTGSRLTVIARNQDGRYRLSLLRDGQERMAVADRVVVTIPFPLLRGVDLTKAGFRTLKLHAIRALGMGRNTKLQLQFSERFWQRLDCNGEARMQGAFETSWDATRAQPGTPGILNFFSGGSTAERAGQGFADDAARRALRDLEPALPGATAAWNGHVVRNAWDRHPWSLGSYALLRPGQYTSLTGVEGEREGHVYFAGEHTSAESQGYMNGAVESGQRAAAEVLASLGFSRARRSATG